MNRMVLSAFAVAAATLAACSSNDTVGPSAASLEVAAARGSGSGGGGGGGGGVSAVTCELRVGSRSKVSVNLNNLTPLNAQWGAAVTSGGVTVSAPLARAVGDEVEFDFDSDPANIRRGATAISRAFIVPNAAGPDVVAAIRNAAGAVVATLSGECVVR